MEKWNGNDYTIKQQWEHDEEMIFAASMRKNVGSGTISLKNKIHRKQEDIMIVLRASTELKRTFEKLITTMKVPVKWNGLLIVIDNYIFLQGEVRSLFFHFDSRKVVTNIIDITVKPEQIQEASTNIHMRNVINMLLYAFGKWGKLTGVKVDKSFSELNILFKNIMRELSIDPDYTIEHFYFYREKIRITYEDVLQAALEYKEEEYEAPEEEAGGLWYKFVWKRETLSFEQVQTTIDDRKKGRIGNNFYMIGLLCPDCRKKIHMTVYPQGKEFLIETVEGGVLLARAAVCSHCHSFFAARPKWLLSEGDVYTMRFGEDEKAYEDYLALLGKNGGAAVSNNRYNMFADGRADAEDAGTEGTLDEACSALETCSDEELDDIEERMQEGFYPVQSVRRWENKVRQENIIRKKRKKKAEEEVAAKQKEKQAESQKAVARRKDLAENSASSEETEGWKSRRAKDMGEPSRVEKQKTAKKNTDTKKVIYNKRNAVGNRRYQEFEEADRYAGGNMAGSGSRRYWEVEETDRYGDENAVQGGAENSRYQETDEKDIYDENANHHPQQEYYEAKMEAMERYSGRMLTELKQELTEEEDLPPDIKKDFSGRVQKQLEKVLEYELTKRIRGCIGTTYEKMKRVLGEVEKAELSEERKAPLRKELKQYMQRQGTQEVNKLMQSMPEHMARETFQEFEEKLKGYGEVDMEPYQKTLYQKKREAEQAEIANLVRHLGKNTREELLALANQLSAGGYLPELAAPCLEKIKERVRQMDEQRISEICPNPEKVSYDEGVRAFQRLRQEELLPELRDNAISKLAKRLSRIKAKECDLLVKKLEEAMGAEDIALNDRHYFYPANKVLAQKAEPEETAVIDAAMAAYADGNGLFEYPIIVVDTSWNHSGKEGLILTPEHVYYSTLFGSKKISVRDIEEISCSTGFLNKNVFAHCKDGSKYKLPYAIDAKELPEYSKVLDEFIHYLREKPVSRRVDYLAKESHTTICCFRCGYVYTGDVFCPKCGYENK